MIFRVTFAFLATTILNFNFISMVFFACENCGENVKKQQVDKHLMRYKCKLVSKVSCLDCGKVFGLDYVGHTKCISEEEKYSGKLYDPSKNVNKGEVKQEIWIQKIQSQLSSANIDGNCRQILTSMLNYPNIPRKVAKFEKFMQNSLNVKDPETIKKIWGYMTKEETPTIAPKKETKSTYESSNKRSLETDTNNNAPAIQNKKLKKLKTPIDIKETNGHHSESQTKDHDENKENLIDEDNLKFNVEEHLEKLLEVKQSEPCSLNSTHKKLVKRYRKHCTSHQLGVLWTEEQLLKKIRKKIKKLGKYTIDGDCIKLVAITNGD